MLIPSLLTGLSESIIEAFDTPAGDGLFNVSIRHLGGALTRPSDNPAGALTAPYLLALNALSTSPSATQQRVTSYFDSLASVDSGRVPFNFLAPDQGVERVFSSESLQRLRDIDRHRDPAGVFRSNHPVSM